jgi:hypothetical protein
VRLDRGAGVSTVLRVRRNLAGIGWRALATVGSMVVVPIAFIAGLIGALVFADSAPGFGALALGLVSTVAVTALGRGAAIEVHRALAVRPLVRRAERIEEALYAEADAAEEAEPEEPVEAQEVALEDDARPARARRRGLP